MRHRLRPRLRTRLGGHWIEKWLSLGLRLRLRPSKASIELHPRVDKEEWAEMNKNNFWRAKECMQLATKEQADANVKALLKWKDRLGPKLWREMYVIIPTVWPMSRTNTRLELFRGLLERNSIGLLKIILKILLKFIFQNMFLTFAVLLKF